jgi:hypothetical protein
MRDLNWGVILLELCDWTIRLVEVWSNLRDNINWTGTIIVRIHLTKVFRVCGFPGSEKPKISSQSAKKRITAGFTYTMMEV